LRTTVNEEFNYPDDSYKILLLCLNILKQQGPDFQICACNEVLGPKTPWEEECVRAIHICIHNGRLHVLVLKMQIC